MSTAPAIAVEVRSRIPLDREVRDEARARIGRRLGRHAGQIRGVLVGFEDLNGPRGGVDTRCRVRVKVRGRPTLVVSATAPDARRALGRATGVLGKVVRRELERSGRSSREPRARERTRRVGEARGVKPRRDEGSLIGRRVGRSKQNLERALVRPEKTRRDAWVDTAAPGTSASHRKAGYGATAARNTKRNTSGMTATLEDSRTRPSRKSSRRGGNRSKAATPIARVETQRQASAKSRATKARARWRSGRLR